MIILYVIGWCISWYLAAGMFFANSQGRWPSIAVQGRREDLGLAIALGFLYGFLWPIGLPVALCITGFAEYGVWKVKKRRGQ